MNNELSLDKKVHQPGQLYTVAQAAYRMNISARTVRTLIAQGDLLAYRIGRVIRVLDESINEYLDSNLYQVHDDGRMETK